MILDGRKLAAEVLARAKARAELLSRRPRVVAYVPSDTPATRSYLKIKQRQGAEAGCDFSVVDIPDAFVDADAVIIQLPLPAGVSRDLLDTIPVAKDADVLSAAARALFLSEKERALLPPVVAAMKEIFDTHHVVVKGKQAVVVGNGFLVGAPCATWLRQQGARVEVATSKTDNLKWLLLSADIIVTGVGIPHLIKPDMLKEGVILIDAGTAESSGTIAGDASPSCAAKCSLVTPVPGGVGPLAVAYLFANAVTLAERQQG